MNLVEVEIRARQSRGTSSDAILEMVDRALECRGIGGECIVDVGCGAGNLYAHTRQRFTRYIGVDIVRYEEFPADAEFCRCDLNDRKIPLPDQSADVVTAVEVIEHLENPREFIRNLIRLVKPAGWLIVTTPNQLSLLSLLTLVFRHRFQAFQDVHYPTHLTALLEVDLCRMANECSLSGVGIEYSLSSRVPMLDAHYPRILSRRFPRALSDNLMLIARRAETA